MERYEIDREVGAGGMARVFRARDRQSGEIVALKLLNGASAPELRRFEREAATLRELEHPGIVRYVAHDTGSRPYLAMEWLEGEDLEHHLARGPLSLEDALELVRSVASALGAAHRRGIVHRDVKPGNIFLVDGDVRRVKLLDFGIARDELATANLTMTGQILGTPSYMAPEQARSAPLLDARVDVFALGGVLFACLTQRPPFVASNVVALLAKIVVEDPPRLAELRADIPIAIERLLTRMMAKSPDARFADGDAVVAALGNLPAMDAQLSSKRTAALGVGEEQRVVCILLAAGLQASAFGTEATLDIRGHDVQRLADGSALVTFVGPESPTDLAARAARFALGMRGAGVSLSLATGRAVVSGGVPMGDAIDRAARELPAARSVLWVDATTAALLEGRFDVDGGIVRGERSENDAIRTLLGKPTRCIGRDRELSAIEGHFAECVSESIARAVLITAAAGVGKSRVAREIVRRLAARDDAPILLFARADSVSSGSSFAMIRTALLRAAGITDADPVAERRKKLTERVGDEELLFELAGVAPSSESSALRAARENPALMFGQIRDAFEAWLSRECASRPVVLLMEDLHWGDAPSVALVDGALRSFSDRPFIVLALARPEVHEVLPGLWTAHAPHELRLDPLARRASERLVREAIPSLSDEDVASIVARAQGNAFFLEELVRAAAEGDLASVPDGVLGVVQLRFDALRPDTRAVLRAASVFGERFAVDGVEALVNNTLDVPRAIEELVSRELVAQATMDGVFSFRHALARDAAYAMLTADDRKLAHGLAGAYLERHAEVAPLLLAEHFERGEVEGKAAIWFERAAVQALEGNDLTAVVAHAERARARTDDREVLGRLELLVAEAEQWRNRMREALERASSAAELLPLGSPSWFQAAGLVITTAGQLGDNDPVVSWLERVMAMKPSPEALSSFVLCLARGASQLFWCDRVEVSRRALARIDEVSRDAPLNPYAEARVHFARGYEALYDGVTDECVASFRRAAECFQRASSARDALQAELIEAFVQGFAGLFDKATAALSAIVARALALDAEYLAMWARYELAIIHFFAGRRREGEAEARNISAAVLATPLFAGGMAVARGWAALRERDYDGLERVLDAVNSISLPARYAGGLQAMRACVLLARGESASADALARGALLVLDEQQGMRTDPWVAGYAAAVEVLAVTDPERARICSNARLLWLDETVARMRDPALRESMLHALDWHESFRRCAGADHRRL